MKFQYTAAQAAAMLKTLRENFELVRVVEPCRCLVCSDEGVESGESCHASWEKGGRCENCLSMRVLREKSYMSKLEVLDERAFSVYSKYIEIDGRPRAVEMVNEVTGGIQFGDQLMHDVVREIRQFNRQLITDYLTGAYNRQYLQEHFSGALQAAPPEQKFCLAVMDLDHFKAVNDQYGHPAGDAVLMQVARQWTEALEPLMGAFVARYGGDEFVVVAPNIGYGTFCALIRRIYGVSAKQCALPDGGQVRFTLSVGCASRTQAPGGWDELFAMADRRMYRRKQAGGDGVLCE